MKRHVHVMALAFLGVRVVPGPVVDGLVLAVVLALVMVIVRAVVKHLVCMNAIRLADQHAWVIVRVHAKEGALMDVLALVLEHVLVLPMLFIIVPIVTQSVHQPVKTGVKNRALVVAKLDVIQRAKNTVPVDARLDAIRVAKMIAKVDVKEVAKHTAQVHVREDVRRIVIQDVKEHVVGVAGGI